MTHGDGETMITIMTKIIILQNALNSQSLGISR